MATYYGNDGRNAIDNGDYQSVYLGGGDDYLKQRYGGFTYVEAGAGYDYVEFSQFDLAGSAIIVYGEVYAGLGNDTIIGGLNGDYLNGGAGDDYIRACFNEVSVAGDTIEGGFGSDALYGNGGDDTIYGGEGDDSGVRIYPNSQYYQNGSTLTVQAGLYGGAGIDYLDGGRGNDFLDGGSGTDTIVGGTDNDTINGGADNDIITGDAGNDFINGGTGADRLSGGDGNDTVVVDNASDTVVEASGGGIDIVYTSTSYTLTAGQEIETLSATATGSSAALTLKGNEFSNTIQGYIGADIIDGNAGADTLIGADGGDSYYVDTASDRIIEAAGGGSDTVYASASYTLNAGQEIEQLRTNNDAGTAALKLTGNELANRIVGNAGANTINGGLGSDTLYGKAGKDTFVFANTPSASNRDHLGDFSAADDTIQLSKAIFTALSAGTLAASAFKDLSVSGATVDASDRILYSSKLGTLSYDADGSGTKAAVQFAVIDTKVALTNADFFVV